MSWPASWLTCVAEGFEPLLNHADVALPGSALSNTGLLCHTSLQLLHSNLGHNGLQWQLCKH